MEPPNHKVELAPGLTLGGEQLILIAGPCAIESRDVALIVAKFLRDLCRRLGIGYIFKASYDKANRTSGDSFRSIGFELALDVLLEVRRATGVPILTDVHRPDQVAMAAEVVDVLQIPAFLCRQTDLLLAAGASGRPVNIKKGQFMAPDDMRYAVEKVRSSGNQGVFLTERGTMFGYHDLVVDMRALPIMRKYAPVVFDVTHSVQMPGSGHGTTGGQREFTPHLARSAAAAGVDGFFIETHPTPDHALSDGQNMIPLGHMEQFLKMTKAVWERSREFFL